MIARSVPGLPRTGYRRLPGGEPTALCGERAGQPHGAAPSRLAARSEAGPSGMPPRTTGSLCRPAPPGSAPGSGSGGYTTSPPPSLRGARVRGRGGSSPDSVRRRPLSVTTTWRGARPRPPWKSWSACPRPAGGWKKRSSSRSRPPGWPTTRCAPSTAGIGTSPWPSLLRPSWLSRPQRPPTTRSPDPAPNVSRKSCTPAWTRLRAHTGASPTPPAMPAPSPSRSRRSPDCCRCWHPRPAPAERIRHGLHWSRWRRRHQAVARPGLLPAAQPSPRSRTPHGTTTTHHSPNYSEAADLQLEDCPELGGAELLGFRLLVGCGVRTPRGEHAQRGVSALALVEDIGTCAPRLLGVHGVASATAAGLAEGSR